MASATEILEKLKAQEAAASDNAALQEVEASYEDLAPSLQHDADFLIQRNSFRVQYAALMAIPRPKVLHGLINGNAYPNFHTMPLLRIADVASLSFDGKDERPDRIPFNIITDTMDDIIGKLPLGFQPDIFWDPQACGGSTTPRGLSSPPFMTIAGFHEHHRAVELYNLAYSYDAICPLSTTFADIFKSCFPDKEVFDLPFGVNWGSFHHFIPAGPAPAEREIDILLTFDGAYAPAYGQYRAKVHEAFQAFKDKYGDKYRLEFQHDLSPTDYLGYLQRSKIVLNAVGLHGPYNHRLCEAMNAGAVLMQIDAQYATGDQKIGSYFKEGEEFILFDETNFEEKALSLLEDPDKLASVAAAGKARLETEYSYEMLYLKLLQTVQEAVVAKGGKLNRLPQETASATRALAMFHSNRPEKQITALLDLPTAAAQMNMQFESALLPHLKCYTSMVTPENLANLFGDHEALQKFPENAVEGYKACFDMIEKPSLIDRWNLAVQCFEAGDRETVRLLGLFQELLKAEAGEFSAMSFFTTGFQIEGFDEQFHAEARVNLLNLGVLTSLGDGERISRAIQGFMLFWVCILLAHAGDTSADWQARANAFLG